jgi:hypothetical protein
MQLNWWPSDFQKQSARDGPNKTNLLGDPSGRLCRRVRVFTSFWCCVRGFSLDSDLHVRTGFEPYFLTALICQGVVDAYFSIKMIPAFNSDLRFFWFVWKRGLDDLFNGPRQDRACFFGHVSFS